MKICKHQYKFIESSTVYKEKIKYRIDKYRCIKCFKWYFVNKETNRRIQFRHGLGSEAE